MKRRVIRVAVIGLGFGHAVHLPVFYAMENVSVVAVMGTDKIKVQTKIKDNKDIVACSTINELLEQNPDIVSIAVPPTAIMSVLEPLLRRRIPVLTEKPLALNLSDAETLNQQASGLLTAVDFQFAELSCFQLLSQRLSKNMAGKVRHVHIDWLVESYAQRHHKVSWKTIGESGGVLPLMVSHSLYLIEWLLGKIKSIKGDMVCSSKEGWDLNDSQIPADLVCLKMLLANNAPLTATIGNANPGMNIHRWTIVCENGSYVLENANSDYMAGFTLNYFTHDGPDCGEMLIKESSEKGQDARLSAFQSLAMRFVSAYNDDLLIKPDFTDGVRVQALCGAIIKSSKTGHAIEV